MAAMAMQVGYVVVMMTMMAEVDPCECVGLCECVGPRLCVGSTFLFKLFLCWKVFNRFIHWFISNSFVMTSVRERRAVSEICNKIQQLLQ